MGGGYTAFFTVGWGLVAGYGPLCHRLTIRACFEFINDTINKIQIIEGYLVNTDCSNIGNYDDSTTCGVHPTHPFQKFIKLQ